MPDSPTTLSPTGIPKRATLALQAIPSGLTDTMWDLIVDAVGTFLVAVYGYRYMRRDERSLIERWIQRFVRANPRLFPPT